MAGGGRRLRSAQLGQLVIDELHADAQVLDQFGQRGFLDFRAFGADVSRPGDFREVGQDLGNLGRQRAARKRPCGTEPVQEALGPGAERLDAFGERRLVGRQQGLELHVAAVEDGATLFEQLVQWPMPELWPGGALRHLGQEFLEPFGRQVDAPRAERADETTVRLGRRDDGATGRQGLRHFVITDREGHHAYRTTASLPRRRYKLITPGPGSIVFRTMNEPAARSAVDVELRRIERRLEELVATVGQLKEENRALRQRQESLIGERANLLQKNEQVRARVEAMIGRLKAMEQS